MEQTQNTTDAAIVVKKQWLMPDVELISKEAVKGGGATRSDHLTSS